MNKSKICVIIGASHAGVNCAFALRKESWQGKIILLDSDPHLPYHRPPLSKTYLSSEKEFEVNILKSKESYFDANIDLRLGIRVSKLDADKKELTLNNGDRIAYDKLVLAVGADAFLPNFKGLEKAKNLFTLRKAADSQAIKHTFSALKNKRVVVIGGGYIGLETAASLRKLGAEVSIIERESRLLARVTAPQMSEFFANLHTRNGVKIYPDKTVEEIRWNGKNNTVICADASTFEADMIIVGVGIRVNTDLAIQAGIEIENGICVDPSGKTSDPNIYAIGDCAYQFNAHYGRKIRLESVQNAVDQAKIAAASICGGESTNNAIPWFWSDQYDVKLQLVGLSTGYNELIIRHEKDKPHSFSAWYFKDAELLSVDAVNNARAYVLGGKFIKGRQQINKANLSDETIDLNPKNLIQK